MYNGDMRRQPVQSHRELIIWQRAIQLCVAVYEVTRSFPRDEIYGLTNQLRRASVSIPSNIAEGYGRLSREQYRHFLGIAQGSNLELQTQLVIAKELGYVAESAAGKVEAVSYEVGKMLTALLKKLQPMP
jgi:four helix bundle protein